MKTIKLQFELDASKVTQWSAENITAALLSEEEISDYYDKPLVITEEFLKGIRVDQATMKEINNTMASIAIAYILFQQAPDTDNKA